MKSHTIEVKDLQNWIETEYLTFASSTRERKKLVATLHGGFKVIVDGTVVWEGMQTFAAGYKVNKYISVADLIEPLFILQFLKVKSKYLLYCFACSCNGLL